MPHRRSALFADKQFQVRSAAYVCVWLVALCLVYPAIIYNLFGYFIQIIESKNSAVTAASMASTRNKVLILLLALQGLFIAGAFLTSLFITHRVVGPLTKLKSAMLAASEGNFNQRLQLRREDSFHELAEAYNLMTDDVRNRLERTVERLSAAVSSLQRAQEEPNSTQREIEETLSSLRNGLKELQ